MTGRPQESSQPEQAPQPPRQPNPIPEFQRLKESQVPPTKPQK